MKDGSVVLLPISKPSVLVFKTNEERNLYIFESYYGLNGRAEKKQVQYMTVAILGLKAVPKPDDAADALACALCHAQTNAFMAGTSMDTIRTGGDYYNKTHKFSSRRK